jgi:hypothetical protein
MSHRTPLESGAAPPSVRRGFVLVQDTLCDGVVPGEWSTDGGVILYDTWDAAELERAAWAELHDEAMRDAFMAPFVADDELWIEPAELHPDGSLVLPERRCAFSRERLRSLC